MSNSIHDQSDVFFYYPRLLRVREYVIENLSDSIPVSKVAKIACLEEKYFSTFFHKKTGICFKDWLRQLRIERAMQIIRSTDTTITQIAFIVGYRDLRSFERAFKKFTGMTPLSFKHRARPY